MEQPKRKIGFGIITLTSFVALCLVIAFIYRYQLNTLYDAAERQVQNASKMYTWQQQRDAQTYAGLIESLINDDQLLELWQQRDRQALIDYLLPRYRLWNKQFNVTHFYLIDVDRLAFLRLHNPQDYGDIIRRQTLTKAIQYNVISSGLEIGKAGTFTLRVVYPWYQQDQLVGYIELGEEIDHFALELEKVFDAQLVVTVQKQFIQEDNYRSWRKGLNLPDTWDDYPDVIVAHNSWKHAPIDLAPLKNNIKSTSKNLLADYAHHHVIIQNHLITSFPLLDVSGKWVGTTYYALDLTEPLAQFHLRVAVIAALLSLFTGALITMGYICHRRTLNKSLREKDQLLDDVSLSQDKLDAVNEFSRQAMAMLDKVAVGVCVIDSDMKIIKSNQTLKNWFPNHLQDSSQRCYELFHDPPRLVACSGCPAVLAFDDAKSHQHLISIMHNDREMVLRVNATPLYVENGRVQKVVETLVDVTGQCETEKNLQDNQQRFRSLVGNIPGAVFRCRFDQDWTMDFISNYIQTITGYRADDFINNAKRPYADILYPDDVPIVKRVIYDAVRDMKAYAVEYRVKCADGNLRWLYEQGRPFIKNDGMNIWIDGAIFDITDRKKDQQQIAHTMEKAQQAQHQLGQTNDELKRALDQANQLARQAETANRAKSDFLANMSHEIRTPLNAIIGFSEVLAQEELDEMHYDYVNIIYQAGENLLAIVNDVLDFSKIETDQINIVIAECRLQDIVDGVDSYIRPRADTKKIKLNINADNLPEYIQTDRLHLRQCLLNLLSNAVKFTNQGSVTLDITTQQNDAQTMICFNVSDTGIGIAQDELENIFDFFSQVDTSSTRQYGGIGLGLAITRKLAQLLGGSINVQSQPDKGSTFTLMIPLVTTQPAIGEVLPELKQPEIPHLKGRILVAEDEHSHQELIQAILSQFDLDVVMVDNGLETLENATQNHYDLILLDMQLPKMSGFEAAALLRQRNVKTPIVALTVYSEKEIQNNQIRRYLDDVIPKPLDKKRVVDVLIRYLNTAASSPEPDNLKTTSANTTNMNQPKNPQTLTETPMEPAPQPEPAQENVTIKENPMEDTPKFNDDFFTTLPQQIQHLEQALGDMDMQRFNELVTSLKNDSDQAGCDDIVRQASAIEYLVVDQELNQLQRAVEDLKTLCQKASKDNLTT